MLHSIWIYVYLSYYIEVWGFRHYEIQETTAYTKTTKSISVMVESARQNRISLWRCGFLWDDQIELLDDLKNNWCLMYYSSYFKNNLSLCLWIFLYYWLPLFFYTRQQDVVDSLCMYWTTWFWWSFYDRKLNTFSLDPSALVLSA